MASTIDAAITNLVALLETRKATDSVLANVLIHDGPPREESDEWLAVGYTPGGDPSAVENLTYENKDVGGRFQVEKYDLLCSLVTDSGDEEALSVRRIRAIAIRDSLAAVLRADATLSAAVETARMSSAQVVQEQTKKGPSVGVIARIACTAVIAT